MYTQREKHLKNVCTSIVSLTEYNSGTIQKLSFGVNTTIELRNVTAT